MPKSILDPDFKYTNSHETDIRKRFNEARKALGIVQPKPARAPVEALPLQPDRAEGGGGEVDHPGSGA